MSGFETDLVELEDMIRQVPHPCPTTAAAAPHSSPQFHTLPSGPSRGVTQADKDGNGVVDFAEFAGVIGANERIVISTAANATAAVGAAGDASRGAKRTMNLECEG